MLASLIKLANKLDNNKQIDAANKVDEMIVRLAATSTPDKIYSDLTSYAKDKEFDMEDHDWNEALISKNGIEKTRGQIRDYYTDNLDKIFPYIKDRDAIILLGVSKNKTVLKRNIDEDGKRIHITDKLGKDNQNSLEYWILRRAIEIHLILQAKDNIVYIDLDPTDEVSKLKAKKIVPRCEKVLQDLFPGATIQAFSSGKTGIHVMAFLKNNVDIDEARDKLHDALDKEFESEEDYTTKIAKPGQVRLDYTLNKRNGSVRAPYSFSVDGKAKLPLK